MVVVVVVVVVVAVAMAENVRKLTPAAGKVTAHTQKCIHYCRSPKLELKERGNCVEGSRE